MLIAGLGLIMLATIGCNSASNTGDEARDRIPPAIVDQGTIGILQDAGKEFQLSLVVDDGELSWTEYDRLYHSLQQCVIERGGELVDARLLASNSYQFAVGSPPGSDAVGCIQDFWEPLGPLWSFGHRPSEEVLLAANRALADCLRAGGVDIGVPEPTGQDLRALGGISTWLTEPFWSCSQSVSEEYGLPQGFAGYTPQGSE